MLAGTESHGPAHPAGTQPASALATVVGVIGNVRHDQVALPPRPEAYENYFQHAWEIMSLLVRHDGDARRVAAAIRGRIRAADPGITIPEVASMEEVVSTSRDRRFLMWVLPAFGSCAAVLAATGIYGVVAHAVAQRTREIGIRTALGAQPWAQPRDISRLILRGGVRMAAIGVITGLAAALGGSRALRTLVYG